MKHGKLVRIGGFLAVLCYHRLLSAWRARVLASPMGHSMHRRSGARREYYGITIPL
jgi:hypothetical protein